MPNANYLCDKIKRHCQDIKFLAPKPYMKYNCYIEIIHSRKNILGKDSLGTSKYIQIYVVTGLWFFRSKHNEIIPKVQWTCSSYLVILPSTTIDWRIGVLTATFQLHLTGYAMTVTILVETIAVTQDVFTVHVCIDMLFESYTCIPRAD